MKRRNFLKFLAGLPALALVPWSDMDMVWEIDRHGYMHATHYFWGRGERQTVGWGAYGFPSGGRVEIERTLRWIGRQQTRLMNARNG